MNKNELQELREIEERLRTIINKHGIPTLEGKLGDAWSALYDYLEEREE